MPEMPVKIPSGRIDLEACYEIGNGTGAALICHPHPLYGGSMENNVVLALQNALSLWGWGTLRFNFRGVGGSGGQHGNGEGEVEDVLAAVAFLRGKGHETIHVAGYSYGAWIVLKAVLEGLHAASLLLVSPPLDFMDFSGLQLPSTPCLITLGEQDDYCRLDSLQQWLEKQPNTANLRDVAVFPGGDHFYWGVEQDLSLKVGAFLSGRFRRNGG